MQTITVDLVQFRKMDADLRAERDMVVKQMATIDQQAGRLRYLALALRRIAEHDDNDAGDAAAMRVIAQNAVSD